MLSSKSGETHYKVIKKRNGAGRNVHHGCDCLLTRERLRLKPLLLMYPML